MAVIAHDNPGRALTVNGTAEATIIDAIVFSTADVLNFGTISPGAASSVVTIAPNTGARTVSGDASLVPGGGEQDGTFSLDGTDGEVMTVDIPANGDVTLTATLDTLDVNDFKWSYNGGAVNNTDGTLTLATGGPHVFSVGAALTVPANAVANDYTGTYSVTINYQ